MIAAEDEVGEWGWFDLEHLPQPLFLPLHNLLSGNTLSGEGGLP